MTHDKNYVVHLNVWLIISHMIDDAIKYNKGIKKKKKKIIIIKFKKKMIKVKMEKREPRGGTWGRGEKYFIFFFSFFS